MTVSSVLELSSSSYRVCLDHALKYSHNAVLGILLGEVDNNKSVVRVHRVVPAFHSYPTAPIIDICLQQVCVRAGDGDGDGDGDEIMSGAHEHRLYN